jgi:hypothetical protein
MRTANSGPRAAQATPKPKKTVASIAAAAGLIVIVASALAGCGKVSAGGTASGSGSGNAQSGHQAGSGQPASGHARSGGGRQSGSGIPSGHGSSHQPVASGGDPMIRLLCAEPRGITSVRVVRFAGRSQLGQTKPLPRPVPGITISDPAAVRRLAGIICRLPKMPRGVISCPANVGGGYVLVFSAPGERYRAVTLLASGCETVTGTGAGSIRWIARTPLFWQELAQLTGIASPAHTQT